MNNYNSMFNTMSMIRGPSPFVTAGSNSIGIANNISRGGLLSKIGSSKLSLSGILNGAQKTIGTVNQIVPLYNQVKPLVQNSKVLLNVAKGLRSTNSNRLFPNKRKQSQYNNQSENIKKENVIDINEKQMKANENEPSKPYFV